MASPSPAPGQTNLGVAPNVGGLLCYVPCCIGFIFSVVAAIVEKQSKFVRFHAFQSLLLHAAAFVCLVAIQIVGVMAAMASSLLALLVHLVGMVLGLGLLGVCIFLMIKANGNEEVELPVIGEMARKWA
jgi:uncharacterized membrane protein